MSLTTILERIRGLFASKASEPFGSTSDAVRKSTLNDPVRPMSDQELACAIREFRVAQVSDCSIPALSRRFVEASVPRNG